MMIFNDNYLIFRQEKEGMNLSKLILIAALTYFCSSIHVRNHGYSFGGNYGPSFGNNFGRFESDYGIRSQYPPEFNYFSPGDCG